MSADKFSFFEPGEPIYAEDYIAECGAPEMGVELTLTVTPSQMDAEIIKPDCASMSIPELAIDQEGGNAGFQGTIRDMLEKFCTDMEMVMPHYPPHDQEKMRGCISRVRNAVSNNGAESIRLIVRDPLGLCEVRAGSGELPSCQTEQFVRTWTDKRELDLLGPVDRDPRAESDQAAYTADVIRNSQRIVVLTGAGVSVESGIEAFRTGDEARWKRYDPAQHSLQSYRSSPDARMEAWKLRAEYYPKMTAAKPNPAHEFCGRLCEMGKLLRVITQNIDGLHQKGGVDAGAVYEIHGSTHSASCMECGEKVATADMLDRIREMCEGRGGEWPDDATLCTVQGCSGRFKCDSIAFGEELPKGLLFKCAEDLKACDCLVIIGSSLVVAPVNTLPIFALDKGVPVIMINLASTQYDDYVSALIREPAGAFLAKVSDAL